MSIANIDLNTLLAGSSGFALATVFFVIVGVKYVMPAFFAREEKRESQHEKMVEQIGRLADVINQLVMQNAGDMDTKIDKLRDLISHNHEPEKNPAH